MPHTIENIVCTVDFSQFSPMVVQYGMVLSKTAGVPLTLIHGVNEPQDRLHPTAMFERGGDLKRLTDEAQERMATLMRRSPVQWEAVVCSGDPAEQTSEFVRKRKHCLVVSASHGVSGFKRLFVGTVVERLTRLLPCPMLVVKPGFDGKDQPFGGFRSMVIGCDDHGCWRRLAPLLTQLQSCKDQRIHLILALERPLDQEVGEDEGASYGQVQQALQDRRSGELLAQGKQLFPHAASISVTVAPGVPQEMLLDSILRRAADLVVVGVRPSGQVGRWFSGSTTEAVLRRSPCAVLTVPEKKNRNQHPGDEI